MAGYDAQMDGAAVREWRIAHGLSQQALATYLGVDKTTLYLWEKGRRRVPPMLALALEALHRRLTDEKDEN